MNLPGGSALQLPGYTEPIEYGLCILIEFNLVG